MSKYMIRCDIEGVSGVVSYQQAEPGGVEYEYGQRMFMADLMAAIDGLNSGGASEIVIYDEHYYGRNIDVSELPDNVTAICGKPPYCRDWAGGLDASFTGMILVGFHSKFGTPNGLLHHSYEIDIKDLRLNGVSVGEIGMEAAIAGEYGVPVLLVTGDSAGVAEAEALLPGVRTVTVKESINDHGGTCYPLRVTTRTIREAAASVVNDPPVVAPYKTGPGAILEVELNAGMYLDTVLDLFRDEMINENTLAVNGESPTDVWASYWQKKIVCQKREQLL